MTLTPQNRGVEREERGDTTQDSNSPNSLIIHRDSHTIHGTAATTTPTDKKNLLSQPEARGSRIHTVAATNNA